MIRFKKKKNKKIVKNVLLVLVILAAVAAAAWAMDRFLHLPAGVCYLLAAAAAFGGGYGLNALISKTPVLRWCVLGKRKEKRHVSG